MNTLLVVGKTSCKTSWRILCLAHDTGRRHDLTLLRRSKVRLHPHTRAVLDSGFQGLQKQHPNTDLPKKRSKNTPLSKTDRARNRAIARERVACENVIARLKRFKIIADRYRNRRRRFGLRFFLIAALYNAELPKEEVLQEAYWRPCEAISDRVPWRGVAEA